jgi:hypothetical protein
LNDQNLDLCPADLDKIEPGFSGLGVAGWQNPLEPHDVDWNGFVTPVDVLQVINRLNRQASEG